MKRRSDDIGKPNQEQPEAYCGPPQTRSSAPTYIVSDPRMTSTGLRPTLAPSRIIHPVSGSSSPIPPFAPGPSRAIDYTEILPVNIQYCTPSYSGNIPGSCVSTAVKVHGCLSTSSPASNPIVSSVVSSSAQQHQNFQRLKVEDALSYLDQVKFKFGNQPQVYNDFLDIMKEFKSQSIDTPGVIQRVSNLFKGHPELIVGFNTFLPPGYKIEVQSSDQGHSFQVSVSMPSPSSVTAVPPHITAGMVTHHLAIPGRLGSPIPATATHAAPIPPGIVKPLHSPILNVPAATAVYHTVATSSVPVVERGPSPPPMVPHHYLPAPSSPVPGPSGYSSPALSVTHADHSMSQIQGQPVEFNHAINYVNKIKNRFQDQPEKYKKFLEILHTYQKEQRSMKEGHLPLGKYLTEAEVYAQVAKLFERQDDLLIEFGQFLPDATCHQAGLVSRVPCSEQSMTTRRSSVSKQVYSSSSYSSREPSTSVIEQRPGSSKFGHSSGHPKRSSSAGSSSQGKKQKIPTLRDIPMTEAAKYTTLNDFAFFDKVKKALRNQVAYENFLRTLSLYNYEIVSSAEIMQLITPFLGKFPELFRWFKHFMRLTKSNYRQPQPQPSCSHQNVPEISNNDGNNDRVIESLEEIDYTTCQRLGASYCVLPSNYKQPNCSGRTPLCDEVLNDTWVSFPSWSEDSTFVTSKKTQYEEYIYKCEDERYELDLVIETNTATILNLERVNKQISRMSPDEATSFRLDDCLGGTSPTIHIGAVKRIYGEKADDVIEGLKKNPAVSVPVVLRRLKAKEEEWRQAQKGFNRVWREQNEKYYMKSLDHQTVSFKSSDLKALRSKSLFSDVEKIENEAGVKVTNRKRLTLPYRSKNIMEDSANLLINHVKRQTSVQQHDKRRVKLLLKHFIPDMFFQPHQELSEDEAEEEEKTTSNKGESNSPTEQSVKDISTESADDQGMLEIKRSIVPSHARGCLPDESYSLFYANSTWYLFLRLYQILCERISSIFEKSRELTEEEAHYKQFRRESTAMALRLRPKYMFDVEKFYPAFLDMLRKVMDGSIDFPTFEDSMREMYGIHAYVAFTIDKIINYTVRQLHNLVSDQTCRDCLDLFQDERKRGGSGGDCKDANLRFSAELAYLRKAEKLISPDNIYKAVIYKQDSQMTLERQDAGDISRLEAELEEKLQSFGEGCSTSAAVRVGGSQTSATVTASDIRDRDDDRLDLSTEDNDELELESGSTQRRKPIFLPRNVRIWKQRSGHLGMPSNFTEERMREKKTICEIESKQGSAVIKIAKRKNSASSSEEEIKHRTSTRRKRKCTTGPETRAAASTLCNLNVSQYHLVFMANKENYLYRRQALQKAHQLHSGVSLRLGTKFHRWHVSWVAANVSECQHQACVDWLMGRGEDFIPNRTYVLTDNDLNHPPYHTYNRYRVVRLNLTGTSCEE